MGNHGMMGNHTKHHGNHSGFGKGGHHGNHTG